MHKGNQISISHIKYTVVSRTTTYLVHATSNYDYFVLNPYFIKRFIVVIHISNHIIQNKLPGGVSFFLKTLKHNKISQLNLGYLYSS